MKEKIVDRERLRHMLEAIEDILEFSNGIELETYNQNKMLRLAIVKLIETIGEASSSITDELKTEFNDIDWHVLKGIRNIIVHEYFGINYTLIWNTIQNDIPVLKKQLLNILAVRDWH